MLSTATIKNSGRTVHSRYTTNIYARYKEEGASSSRNKSLKKNTGTTSDKGAEEKLSSKDVANEKKSANLISMSKGSSTDNNSKKIAAVKTGGTEYIDNLKVKKIRYVSTNILLNNLK